MNYLNLSDKITVIKGIGEKSQNIYGKIGIYTVQDLLEHYPRGYDEFEPAIPIVGIQEGKIIAIEASVVMTPQIKKVRNLQIISALVKDSSATMYLTWFNMSFLQKTLKMGLHYIFRGKVIRKNGILVMEQPGIYQKEQYYKLRNVLQPVYPLTQGLTNTMISKAVKAALPLYNETKDYIPKALKKQYDLMERGKAISEIHFPKERGKVIKARERLVFDEFFLYSVGLRRFKENKALLKTDYVMKHIAECDQLIGSLPYALTRAQLRVWEEIRGDLGKDMAMNRLVQGDVGSGKTVLAILAIVMAVKNGYQASFMVPTEVLAKQHYQSLTELLAEFHMKVCLLVGSMTGKEKRIAYDQIKRHEADIIIGTHALIQEKVEYDQLALVITDEQHRFGVKQREAMMKKGTSPHVLVMSATPIPRTLAMILYGDLDISVVDELPANRLPIKNCVVDTNYRPIAYRFINKQVAEGRQAYVICPMVEESEETEAENVIDYAQTLQESLSPQVVVEYLHGKMKPRDKTTVMERFTRGEIQVLVSTTVIEVGVNVPNATVMMVENSERFGLAQLHQLRGRVGRGGHQSYCIFVCASTNKETLDRLEILNQSNDGFFIAGEDLRLRGPGDIFGIRQSGEMDFKLGDVFTDARILKAAADAANHMKPEELVQLFLDYPDLKRKMGYESVNTL